MELTKEQIQQVDKYLDVKSIKFIDFRIEIFDHIISQIEQEINNGRSFESAFTYIKLKWNSQLRKGYSSYFGTVFTAPKIVLKKARRIFKPFFLFMMLLCILPGVLFYFLDLKISSEIVSKTSKSINIIALLLSSIWLYTTIRTIKDKIKTVYSFIIKTQILTIIYVPIMMLNKTIEDGLSITLFLVFVSIFILNIVLYKKHQQEKEKYKLLVTV